MSSFKSLLASLSGSVSSSTGASRGRKVGSTSAPRRGDGTDVRQSAALLVALCAANNITEGAFRDAVAVAPMVDGAKRLTRGSAAATVYAAWVEACDGNFQRRISDYAARQTKGGSGAPIALVIDDAPHVEASVPEATPEATPEAGKGKRSK